jgi:CelD/BcsL family acetyltransferase involved in cellulose biosynthesis
LVAPGHEDVLPTVWDAALAPRRHVLQLFDHEAGGPDIDALSQRPAAARIIAPRDTCPVIEIDAPAEAIAARGQRLRRTLSRSKRFQAEEGVAASIEVVRDMGGLDPLLPEIISIYDLAEADHPRLHILRPPWADFTGALMTEAAATDRLRVVLIRFGGRPAGFVIGLRGGTSMNYWFPRFDPAFAKFSPGHLGILALLEESEAMGLRELDLGLGDSEYKRQWSTGEYSTLTVTGAAAPWALRALRVVERTSDQVRRWLTRDRHANMAR